MAALRNDFLTTADRTVFMLWLGECGVLDRGTATQNRSVELRSLEPTTKRHYNSAVLTSYRNADIPLLENPPLPHAKPPVLSSVEKKNYNALKSLRNVR